MVTNPKNRSKPSSGSFNLGKKSVLKVVFCKKKKKKKNQFNKPSNSAPIRSPFSALKTAHRSAHPRRSLIETKVEYPTGGYYTVPNRSKSLNRSKTPLKFRRGGSLCKFCTSVECLINLCEK